MRASAERCGCCGARAFLVTERTLTLPDGQLVRFDEACSHCGLLVADGDRRGESIGEQIFAAVGETTFRLPPFEDDEQRWGMDVYTLRTAATRALRRATPLGAAQRHALAMPHGALAARASLDDLPCGAMPDLAVVLLCRDDEVEPCVEKCDAWLKLGIDVLVVVDAAPGRFANAAAQRPCSDASLQILSRPLAGDFSAQRNFAQAGTRRSWVLQLDADETPGEPLVRSLPGLVAMAERDGILSIGLPRRNLVDGVLSDVYPDIQYRLNRASVRFGGKVHERPMLPQGWRQSFIALSGAIDHHLSAGYVAARSQRYERLAPGHGRVEEARLLMTPYRP